MTTIKPELFSWHHIQQPQTRVPKHSSRQRIRSSRIFRRLQNVQQEKPGRNSGHNLRRIQKITAKFTYLFLHYIYYFVPWPTNAQFFHKLSHSYVYRHYHVILRELVMNSLPGYTRISNAVIDIWYICQLQMGKHPVAVVQNTFTHKQYIEQHK